VPTELIAPLREGCCSVFSFWPDVNFFLARNRFCSSLLGHHFWSFEDFYFLKMILPKKIEIFRKVFVFEKIWMKTLQCIVKKTLGCCGWLRLPARTAGVPAARFGSFRKRVSTNAPRRPTGLAHYAYQNVHAFRRRQRIWLIQRKE